MVAIDRCGRDAPKRSPLFDRLHLVVQLLVAASAAASDSTIQRARITSNGPGAGADMAPRCGAPEGGSTNTPDPPRTSTRPSTSSAVSASRTEWRLTELQRQLALGRQARAHRVDAARDQLRELAGDLAIEAARIGRRSGDAIRQRAPNW
jgi:hypothetical protein